MKTKTLVVYTGGTIGMMQRDEDGVLKVSSLGDFKRFCLSSRLVKPAVEFVSVKEVKDSSEMKSEDWLEINQIISNNYSEYSAFVVLHGTDTMAYSATAISFLQLKGTKPIVFTGAQKPISEANSDAVSNFQGAIEIAGQLTLSTVVQKGEVSIYFQEKLYKANRTTKISTESMSAFDSPNYPIIGGKKGEEYWLDDAHFKEEKLTDKIDVFNGFSDKVALLKIHPAFSVHRFCEYLSNSNVKGLLIETYGAGNIPISATLQKCLKDKIAAGMLVLNVSQCINGKVDSTLYQGGSTYEKIGVLSGNDLTTEAALIKLMMACNVSDKDLARTILSTSISGEQS